jgi:uncharacterized protein YqfB (UPF0267 family)
MGYLSTEIRLNLFETCNIKLYTLKDVIKKITKNSPTYLVVPYELNICI